MVKDFNSITSSSPSQLTNVDGTLFFSASDDENGRELWRSDGSGQGTLMIKDIYASDSSSSAHWYLTEMNGILFFIAFDDAHGMEMRKSDGTDRVQRWSNK
jgi:ELWxxDGT repeat protein